MRAILGTAILGLSIGLGGGFVLANFSQRLTSRAAISNRQAWPSEKNADLTETFQKNEHSETLTTDELRQAVAVAEREKNNWQLQRDLGLGLFRYALLETNDKLLFDAVRLLERAAQKPFLQDREVFQALGDSLFILAQQRDLELMLRSRDAYQKALKVEPNNADLLVSIGLTFFYQQPPQLSPATKYFYQAIALNPKHEKGLESLVVALTEGNKTSEALKLLERLNQVNPKNEQLDQLRIRIEQKKLTIRE